MVKPLTVLLATLLLLSGGRAGAERVRLVVMDGVNLIHLVQCQLPNIQYILEQGAVGLANTNTAGPRGNAGHAALTLSAGSRALGEGAGKVYAGLTPVAGGLAAEVFALRTGVMPPADALVMLEAPVIQQANGQLPYRVRVGYLGERLAAGGKGVAVLVNSDGEGIFRPAAAIAADSRGLIILGAPPETLLVADHRWPYGVKADLAQLERWLVRWSEVEFVVIDPGDTSRTSSYLTLVDPGQQQPLRHQALASLDAVLGLVLAHHRDGDLLLLVGLQPDRQLAHGHGKWLAPVIAYGGSFGPGLLTSPTTRRPGVVANYDITATILAHFHLYVPGEIHGQPLAVVEHPAPVNHLLAREDQMARVYLLRTPLIKGYIGAVIIVVALALAALWLQGLPRGPIKLALAAVAATPLVLLLTGTLPGAVATALLWLAAALMVAVLLSLLSPTRAMTVLGGLTAAAVAADALLLGAWFQQRSLLGYDAIVGARYYGIGNEYMGVLVGSVLLATSGLQARYKPLAGGIYALVTVLLLLPGVGANLGGTLTAAAGFAVALAGGRWLADKRHRLVAVPAIFGLVAVLVVLNLVAADQSHVGQFLRLVAAEPEQFVLTIQRKLSMNWRLIRWSLWSRAFVVLLVAALWLLIARGRLLAHKLGRRWPAVRGAMAAALAALLFNDSGVVAAATVLLYLTLPLLYSQLSSSSLAT